MRMWPCRESSAKFNISSYWYCLIRKLAMSLFGYTSFFETNCMSSWGRENCLMTWQKCQQTTMCFKGRKVLAMNVWLTSSGSVVIEPIHWLNCSVFCPHLHQQTSSVTQCQQPNTGGKYTWFIPSGGKEKDTVHSTCCSGERHLQFWMIHKNWLYQKWIICIPPVSW